LPPDHRYMLPMLCCLCYHFALSKNKLCYPPYVICSILLYLQTIHICVTKVFIYTIFLYLQVIKLCYRGYVIFSIFLYSQNINLCYWCYVICFIFLYFRAKDICYRSYVTWNNYIILYNYILVPWENKFMLQKLHQLYCHLVSPNLYYLSCTSRQYIYV